QACIFTGSAHRKMADFAGTVFERAVLEGAPFFVHDLAEKPDQTPMEREMVRSGERGVMIAPLTYQDKVIGTLGLNSPRPGDLDSGHLPILHEVLPLFAMAVQRSMEELDNRIQA